jgi:hypothetical protein
MKLRKSKKNPSTTFESLVLKNGTSETIRIELEPEVESYFLEPGEAIDARFHNGKISGNLIIYFGNDGITLEEVRVGADEVEFTQSKTVTRTTKVDRL